MESPAANATRRVLKFESLDDVLREIDRLQTIGYQQLGHWDLPQICRHLRCWLTYPVNGFPSIGFPGSLFVALLRWTVAKKMLAHSLATGTMAEGGTTLPDSIPPQGLSFSSEREELARAMRNFDGARGYLLPSPLFGQMDDDTYLRLQLLHCAHHLSFLEPRA